MVDGLLERTRDVQEQDRGLDADRGGRDREQPRPGDCAWQTICATWPSPRATRWRLRSNSAGTVDAYPVDGDRGVRSQRSSQSDINALVDEYYGKYQILTRRAGRRGVPAARGGSGAASNWDLSAFMEEKNYQAIVTHFGDLGTLKTASGAGDSAPGWKRATASALRATGRRPPWCAS